MGKSSPYSSPVVFKLGFAYPWVGVHEDIIREYSKTSYIKKTKHRDRLNLEPALILALSKVRP
jgi:hypothetical protein